MHGIDPTATTHPHVRQPTSPDQSVLVNLIRLWRALWRPEPALHDAVAAAHSRRRTLEGVTPADVRDMGLAREDATGIPTWQPDLPFFMQSGFCRKPD